ncbi:hypothetical protein [Rudanella lutea]|uniref:hypothetical protein n=1 Tax=Rudanella lutea TaxID=451374 RepID=UPI0004845EBD|nr:hypothetical protein [Rudanella lutea]
MKYSPLLACLIALPGIAQDNLIINTPVNTGPGLQNVMVGLRQPTKVTNKANVIIGFGAASSADSVEYSVVIGPAAGNGGRFRKVSSSVVIGNSAGQDNRASNVVMIGQSAGRSNTGPGNIFIGSEAGSTFQGVNSILIGRFATDNDKDAPVRSNGATYIGHEVAGEDSLSTNGTYLGFKTGVNFRTGDGNTFIGTAAGTGFNAPIYARGNFNTFLGYAAGGQTVRTDENVFLGFQAGYRMATGKQNVIIGARSGEKLNEFVEGLVLIGANAQAKSGIQNAVAIGANARVEASNALVLGNEASRVGIGTTNPQNRLEIVAPTAHTSGLRLSGLTDQSPTQAAATKFLSVNAQGDVILVQNTPDDLNALVERLQVLETANIALVARVQELEKRRCFICLPRKPKERP